MTNNKKKIKSLLKIAEPLGELGLNIATPGLGSVLYGVLDKPKNEIFRKNTIKFIRETVPKIKWLEKQVGKKELYKRLYSPEGIQIIAEIGQQIEKESREFNRFLYRNLIVNLFEEDIRVNFNRKIQYASLTKSLNRDNTALLWLFRQHGDEWFTEDGIVEKMGCYEKRKRRKGDPIGLSYFFGIKDDFIIAKNHLKASYVESMISDFSTKGLLLVKKDIQAEGENLIFKENYKISDLGKDFFKYLCDKTKD